MLHERTSKPKVHFTKSHFNPYQHENHLKKNLHHENRHPYNYGPQQNPPLNTFKKLVFLIVLVSILIFLLPCDCEGTDELQTLS